MRNDFMLGAAFVAGIAITVALTAIGGPLTPPAGPVASTFKTIDETPTSRPIGALYTPGDADATFVISESGRYHLTSDVMGEAGKAGIRIDARNAIIDLNGHAVDGQGAGTFGIVAADFDQITISDGVVRNWTGTGIDLGPSVAAIEESVVVSGVACLDNGGNGARIAASGVVSDSEFSRNAANGLEIIPGTVRNCSAQDNAGDGFSLTSGRIVGSSASSNTGFGINADTSVVVMDNSINFNGIAGLRVGGFCRVEGNHFDFNGGQMVEPNPEGAAIVAVSASTIIVNNSATDHQLFVGRETGGSPSRLTVINNQVAGGVLLDFSPSLSTIGPTVTPANVATSTNPHANYLN